MKWASSLSQRSALADALDECQQSIDAQLGDETPADLVLVFASPHYDQLSEPLSQPLRARFPQAVIVGCTGAGIIGAGQELEGTPGLSLTAANLPGVTLHGFHLSDQSMPSPDAPPDEWAKAVGMEADLDPHFILLADPFSLNSEDLLAGMDFAFPQAAKIGGLASGGMGAGSHALYLNDMAYREGAVGVALAGNVIVDTVVAQGCRPIGEPMRITQADRNVLLSADDKPPMETLGELFERMSPREQALAQRNLFMGIAMDPLLEHVQAGDFLIRNIVGVDPTRGAVAVGTQLREGQIVQFHVRDADTSSEDLRESLKSYLAASGGRQASAALLFQCTGRGEHLYGDRKSVV
jgi:small ligand-binding sensory domain FIST